MPEIVVEVLEAFGRALKVCFTCIKICRVLIGMRTNSPDSEATTSARTCLLFQPPLGFLNFYPSMLHQVFYLEACESRSIFEGLLPEGLNIYATTTSNAYAVCPIPFLSNIEPPVCPLNMVVCKTIIKHHTRFKYAFPHCRLPMLQL